MAYSHASREVKMKTGIGFLILLFMCACSGNSDPQKIIDQSIDKYGGIRYKHSYIQFDFRDKQYDIHRTGGNFTYIRAFKDSIGDVRDILTNNAFNREVNGERVTLTDQERISYQASLNSVIYFALLPFPLNDPAAQKRYLGKSKINGESYHKIEVTFSEEQGGSDFEDRFVYWIHQKHKTMDFLAYTFHQNGGGTRFRQALNPRVVNGIRFADYLNFTSDSIQKNIEDYDELFMTGDLKKISEINLENIKVSR